MHKLWIPLFTIALIAAAPVHGNEEKIVHVYNWAEYIGPDTLRRFQEVTGIKVVYDVYDSNEILEAKLLAGSSGYDVVFPSAQPYAQRHIAAGLYQKLDQARLSNYGNLDRTLLKTLQDVDPGNAHGVPYMWGTTGIGYNVEKVRALLGNDMPLNSWGLIFDPAIAAKLGSCGISVLDDEMEALSAALLYLGKDPNTRDPKDIEAAAAAFAQVRPHIKYFHSSQYISDLANGEICVAHGYSGDILQARDRASEAGNDEQIVYSVPREGAILWVDLMMVPMDAPHPDNAHTFIDFLLQPQVIAQISNSVAYANANRAATPLVDPVVRNDPGIYPSNEAMTRLVTIQAVPQRFQRTKVRTWTRIKTGR